MSFLINPIQSLPLSTLTQSSSRSFENKKSSFFQMEQFYQENKEHLHDPSVGSQLQKICDEIAFNYMQDGRYEEAFQARFLATQYMEFHESHPLFLLEEEIVRSKNLQIDPCFGAHFSGFGGAIIKGGHLWADIRNVEDRFTYCFQFKLNDFARKELKKLMKALEIDRSLLQKLAEIFSAEIQLSPIIYHFNERGKDQVYRPIDLKMSDNEAIQLNFKDLGKLIIGNNPQNGCLYNSIEVEIDAYPNRGKILHILYNLLSIIGLGLAVMTHGSEDDERLKIAKLFHTFSPTQACDYERKRNFYFFTISDMKEFCVKRDPKMQEIFQKYLCDSPQLMQKEEIYPGRITWAISDLSDQMRKNGAFGLCAGITGGIYKDDKILNLALMLKNGAMSIQDRFRSGFLKMGISSRSDLASGGGDHVFTRLVTLRNFYEKPDYEILLLYDLNVLNRGGYAFFDDQYGTKNPYSENYLYYLSRLNLVDFARQLDSEDIDNEVMVKNYIHPNFIKGVVVSTQKTKDRIIETLKKENLIIEGSIKGKPVDQFIHVSRRFSKEMWN